jgi:hypothetical protein
MAQTNYTPISLYYSATASATPTAGNLVAGELALNTNDGKLFYKDSSGVVQTLASKAGNVNVSSFSAGSTGLTPSTATTGAVTLAGTLNVANGGTGVTTSTGSGNVVLSTSPTLVTPILGTPTSGTLTNCTGLPNSGLVNSSITIGGTSISLGGSSSAITNDITIHGLTVGYGGSNSFSTVLGYQAGLSASQSLLAVGYQAGYSNTSGADNTAIGSFQTLYSNTTGSSNVAVGRQALQANTTASSNTAVGYQAGYTNATNTALTAIGYKALYNSAADSNTAIGYQAGVGVTSGTQNFFGGVNAGQYVTTGSNNVAIGNQAIGASTSTGSYNTAVGFNALYANTTASNNTAVGYQAGYSNTTASYNTAVGYQAGYSLTTSGANTLLGVQAGYYTTGINNTFVGFNAGSFVTTGTKNTIIGQYGGNAGGLDIRTASNYIVLSDGDGNPRGIFDNSGNFLVGKTSVGDVNLGCQITPAGGASMTLSASTNATVTNAVYSTGAANYRFYVGMGGTIYATSIVITAISDQRLKENIRDLDTGLSTVMALKPRRFDWKEGKGQDKKNAAGFIAQEFQEVLPNSISTYKAGGDGIEYLTMNHEELIPTLVKAIQELKAEFDAYKATHP